jgi:hypothetical protein
VLQVVLVNRNTASTAELIAGALHDDLAAPLIGTTTYGKGRSQRVVHLADGMSTLLVSSIKYFTPQVNHKTRFTSCLVGQCTLRGTLCGMCWCWYCCCVASAAVCALAGLALLQWKLCCYTYAIQRKA